MGFCLLNPLAVKIGVGWLPSRAINESWLMRICQTLMKTWSQYVLIYFTCWIVPRIHLLYNFIPTQDQKKQKQKKNNTFMFQAFFQQDCFSSPFFQLCNSFFYPTELHLSPSLPHLWMVSSCSLTMCASCWNMEPSSTMVLSMFCMVSARLWMYESCCHNTAF